MGKRVAAYAIFGNRDFYWQHIPALVRAHHQLFKGWELRLYHDSTIHSPRAKLIRAFAAANLISLHYHEENKGNCRSMLWRMLPIWDDDVDYVICRDVDSLPTMKDRRAVEQFIQSGAALHCINDNPSHTTPVMGGMCGFHAPQFRKILGMTWEQMCATRQDLNATMGGTDQILLVHQAWDKCFPNVCEHRFAGYKADPRCKASYTSMENIAIHGVPEALSATDGLLNFLGQPGYAVQKAMDMFDELGDPAVTEKIQLAEKQAGITKAQPWEHHPKLALISANENETYDFFLPLTAAMWKKQGWTPYAILVSSSYYQGSRKLQLILRKLHELNAKIGWLPPFPGFEPWNIAQISRLYGGLLDLDDKSYVITGDVDMWPLQSAWYSLPSHSDKMKFWNFAGCDGMFICYCCGTVATWREMMNLKKHTPLSTALYQQMTGGIGPGKSNWGYDEALLNHRRKEWTDRGGQIEVIKRPVDPVTSLPIGRVDRAGWDHSASRCREANCFIDAHLVRPGWTHENWNRIFPLFSALAPEYAQWAADYWRTYISL